MKTIENYVSLVEAATKIGIENFNNQVSVQRLGANKDTLLAEMQNDAYIKVPFVGDFNAGKSSLLNSLMGVSILPTDVVPTTAVSYELYYSEVEKLDIYHEGKFKETAPLSKISKLDVVPGDIVSVYINNDFIITKFSNIKLAYVFGDCIFHARRGRDTIFHRYKPACR